MAAKRDGARSSRRRRADPQLPHAQKTPRPHPPHRSALSAARRRPTAAAAPGHRRGAAFPRLALYADGGARGGGWRGGGLVPRLRPCGESTSRSEERTSELQSLMRISYAVFCLKKKTE